MNSNSRFLVTVLGIFLSVCFSIAEGEPLNDLPGPNGGGIKQGRFFFNLPNLPNLPNLSNLPGFGNDGGLGGLLNCRPLNRTLVQQGLPCSRPNATAINCQNQTCVCTSRSLDSGMPQLPSLPFPIPSFPGVPGMPSISVWNCTSSNGTGPALPPISIIPSPVNPVAGNLPSIPSK